MSLVSAMLCVEGERSIELGGRLVNKCLSVTAMPILKFQNKIAKWTEICRLLKIKTYFNIEKSLVWGRMIIYIWFDEVNSINFGETTLFKDESSMQ